ncbi:hypothetical protein ScPMuIL_013525 [Solemya velum]
MIQLLPSEVRSKLRSGVAISSPTQCIEELVLNSLDAGATCVAVRVDLSCYKIQVVDNGVGISKEDLEKLGERYFTSKCHEVEDLDNLCYYGFRGEALSSLRDTSSILEVISRTNSSSQTFCRLFQKGKPLAVQESKVRRPSPGSTITLHDLFYNLPVRKRAINENLELERIRMRMEGIALMQTNISFTLRNDSTGSIVLQTHKSNGLLSTFSNLFGKKKSRIMLKVEGKKDQYSLDGYIGKEGYSRKDIQFIYINSRMVLKSRIHKLVNKILKKSMLLKRRTGTSYELSPGTSSPVKNADTNARYALFVMNLHCPYSEYDITFDPTKTLVEFKDWDSVTIFINEVINTFLKRENLFVGLQDSDLKNSSAFSAFSPDWCSSGDSTNVNLYNADVIQHDNKDASPCYAKDISTQNARNNLTSMTVRRESDPKHDDEEITKVTSVSTSQILLKGDNNPLTCFSTPESLDSEQQMNQDVFDEVYSYGEQCSAEPTGVNNPQNLLKGDNNSQNLLSGGIIPPNRLRKDNVTHAIKCAETEEKDFAVKTSCALKSNALGKVSSPETDTELNSHRFVMTSTSSEEDGDPVLIEDSEDPLISFVPLKLRYRQTLSSSETQVDENTSGTSSQSVSCKTPVDRDTTHGIISCGSSNAPKLLGDSGYISFETEDPLQDLSKPEHAIASRNSNIENEHCSRKIIEERSRVSVGNSLGSSNPRTRKSIVENLKHLQRVQRTTHHRWQPVCLSQKLKSGLSAMVSQKLKNGLSIQEDRDFKKQSLVPVAVPSKFQDTIGLCESVSSSEHSEPRTSVLSTLFSKQSEPGSNVKSISYSEQSGSGTNVKSFSSSEQSTFRTNLNDGQLILEDSACNVERKKNLREYVTQLNENTNARKRSFEPACSEMTTASKLSRLMRKSQQARCSDTTGSSDVSDTSFGTRDLVSFQLSSFRRSDSNLGCGEFGLIEGKQFEHLLTTESMIQTGKSVLGSTTLHQLSSADTCDSDRFPLRVRLNDQVNKPVPELDSGCLHTNQIDLTVTPASHRPSELGTKSEFVNMPMYSDSTSVPNVVGTSDVVYNVPEEETAPAGVQHSDEGDDNEAEVIFCGSPHVYVAPSPSHLLPFSIPPSGIEINPPCPIMASQGFSPLASTEFADKSTSQGFVRPQCRVTEESSPSSSLGFSPCLSDTVHSSSLVSKKKSPGVPDSNSILEIQYLDSANHVMNDTELLTPNDTCHEVNSSALFQSELIENVSSIGTVSLTQLIGRTVQSEDTPTLSDTDSERVVKFTNLFQDSCDLVMDMQGSGTVQETGHIKHPVCGYADHSSSSTGLGTNENTEHGGSGDVDTYFSEVDLQSCSEKVVKPVNINLTSHEMRNKDIFNIQNEDHVIENVTSPCDEVVQKSLCKLDVDVEEVDRSHKGTLLAPDLSLDEYDSKAVVKSDSVSEELCCNIDWDDEMGTPFLQQTLEDSSTSELQMLVDLPVSKLQTSGDLSVSKLQTFRDLPVSGCQGVDSSSMKVHTAPGSPQGSIDGNLGQGHSLWCQVTDPTTGKPIYVNRVSGHTVIDVDWRPETETGVDQETGGKCEEETKAPQRSNVDWKKAKALGLSQSSHNALQTMMLDHFDEEASVKWRTSSDSSPDHGNSGEGRQSVGDLLGEWNNPVFSRPEKDILAVDGVAGSRSACKAYITVNPCRFTKSMLNNLRVLGQVDNKFIACLMKTEDSCATTEPDLLVLIDQHAAHERVRLEQLTTDSTDCQTGKVTMSKVSPPELLHLHQEEVRLMSSFKSDFQRIGIEFTPDKNQRDCVLIHSIPACITQREASELKRKRDSVVWDSVETLIKEHVQILKNTQGAKGRLPKMLHKILCSQACHGAIKFGDPLTLGECESLLKSLSQCKLPFQCAHGRPSVCPLLNMVQLQHKSLQERTSRPRLWRISSKILEKDL